METTQVPNDIAIMCHPASSFPDGIPKAHQELHAKVPFSIYRRCFGISKPNSHGQIIYKAAAEEIAEGECDMYQFEPMTIPAGNYISIRVDDFIKDVQQIGKAFRQLTAHPEIDPSSYCVEMMLNEKDVLCMVRLKD
jgi:predicted transcriptional regulator YdeE